MSIVTLDQLAKQSRLTAEAEDALAVVKAKLLLKSTPNTVFFSRLAFAMRYEPDFSIETACVDGRKMKYNPEFFMGLTPEERQGVFIHEILHCAFQHFARLKGRRMDVANIAMDLAINQVIRDAGMKLPSCALFPEQFKFPPNLAWEEYYELLLQKKKGGDGEGGEDGESTELGDPGGCGGVESPGDDAATTEAEGQWRIAVDQASELAKKVQGKMAAGLERLIGETLNPKEHWRDILREWLVRNFQGRDTYTWAPPNRRFVSQGIYLPGMIGESIGELVVHVDASGSTWNEETQTIFANELMGVLECRPVKVHIVYCDCQVNRVDEWTPEQGPIVFHPCGGGGTSHAPVWAWIEENDISPICVISLTDGYTSWGDAPQYPVLFAVTKGGNLDAPFGRVIEIE